MRLMGNSKTGHSLRNKCMRACLCLFVSDKIPSTRLNKKNVLIHFRVVFLPLCYPIMPSHLRHLWPLWPSLCSPINPLPWATMAHAHLSGTAGRAAGPGLPGLPSIQSSWKSHLPILLLSKAIKTEKIYNKSVSGSNWEGKKQRLGQGKRYLKAEKQRLFFRKQVRLMTQRSKGYRCRSPFQQGKINKRLSVLNNPE